VCYLGLLVTISRNGVSWKWLISDSFNNTVDIPNSYPYVHFPPKTLDFPYLSIRFQVLQRVYREEALIDIGSDGYIVVLLSFLENLEPP
jgi:hypothetical protein